MNSHHTSKHLQELFAVSHATIQNWSSEFAEFLTPSASPPAGTKRVFQDTDLTVFALVSDYKRRGLTFADAHLALRAGQRGEIPNPTALDKLPSVVQDMIMRMRDEIADLREQLEAERSKTIKAIGREEMARELLEKQLAEKERRITELVEENARLKAKGE